MMQIYKPLESTWPLGGHDARLWTDCYNNTYNPQELFLEKVKPYILDRANKLRSRVFHIPATADVNRLEWGWNIIDGKADYVATTSELVRRKPRRSTGSYRAFEEAKKAGKIVLNPTSVYKLKARGTPHLYPEERSVTREYLFVRTEKTFPNDTKPGVCKSKFFRVPSLELDAWTLNFSGRFEHLKNVTTTPVSKADLDSIMEDILQFSRSPVNSGLVTTVVAEANSAVFDIATEIGEMPETVKMILNFVIEGVKLLLRAKREIKQNLSSGSVIKDAASLWMGYRYGVMPLVYSINDGLDLLEMENRKFQSFRGRLDIPFEKFRARGYECTSAPDTEHRVFLKYGYDLESSIHQGLKINLAATAWELVPLSFVLDWFFQIGDYLTAFFTPGNVNQIGCTYSYKTAGSFVFENKDTDSVITVDAEIYHCDVIQPDSFIGVNSDVFISFKRSMDALALLWLIFKKNPGH